MLKNGKICMSKKNNRPKVWKTIYPSDYRSLNHCLKDLKKKKIFVSPWIEDIIKNKRNKLKITKKKIYLYRITVKNLGFNNPTELNKIYKKIKKNNFKLVSLDMALRSRLKYKEQKKGEWLRFATPMKSMIDTDGVPHLPKLGKALNKYFVETYWSYPKAIFHPHNEFVVCR